MEKKTIRLATFNVYYGRNPLKIAHAIRANKHLKRADVILLQEIEAYPDEAKERAREIAEALNFEFVYAPARETKRQGTHGLAILSRYPIKDSEIVPLPYYRSAFNSRKRIALNAIIDVGGKEVLISNVHLDLRINIKQRIEQARAVIKKLNAAKEQRIVMAGDFNTVPFYWLGRAVPIFYAGQRKKLNQYLKERGFETHLDEIGYTMNFAVLRLSLDSVYVKGVKIFNFGVERTVHVSDHKPIWVDIVV